jgi:hypothetical protein
MTAEAVRVPPRSADIMEMVHAVQMVDPEVGMSLHRMEVIDPAAPMDVIA